MVAPNQPPGQRRELVYGSWEFRAASDLARRLPSSHRAPALIGSVVRDPALARILVAVWRLPIVDLRAGQAEADAWFGDYFRRRAQAVLELPTVEQQYLTGRSKQALRTNLRHALDHGVTSERIPTYEAWFQAASVILHAHDPGPTVAQGMDKSGPGQQVAYYVARGADQTPLAFASVALFGQFAVLLMMLSHVGRQPSSSWARYQLHTFLALDLGCSGVRHLLVGSALRATVGIQYFQHLLGYRARNLRIQVIESGAT
jgi:hypothetical protein